jgi:hypothetical protein
MSVNKERQTPRDIIDASRLVYGIEIKNLGEADLDIKEDLRKKKKPVKSMSQQLEEEK